MSLCDLQVAIVVRGIDTIKAIETLSAPILVALAAALLAWALTAAGGVGPMLAAPSQVGVGVGVVELFVGVVSVGGGDS